MRASSPGERRQNQLRRSLPPIRSPNQIRKSPHCPGSGYRYARFSENHVWPSRVFMIEAPAAASAARNPAPAARPFPEGPQHPFAPRALRSQHAMPRALVTASQILSRILEDPSLPRRRRNQTGMLFTAETQRRRDKRRAHATTASWWNALGNPRANMPPRLGAWQPGRLLHGRRTSGYGESCGNLICIIFKVRPPAKSPAVIHQQH